MSLTLSSEESITLLLKIPAICITRRLVMIYWWWLQIRKSRVPLPIGINIKRNPTRGIIKTKGEDDEALTRVIVPAKVAAKTTRMRKTSKRIELAKTNQW